MDLAASSRIVLKAGPMAASPVAKLRAPLRGGIAPATWVRMTPVQKLQTLYGLALDSALRTMTYSDDELDNPHKLAAHTSARHDILMLCTKWGIELHRDQARERALESLAAGLTRTRAE